jgi:hypothetical protein
VLAFEPQEMALSVVYVQDMSLMKSLICHATALLILKSACLELRQVL